MIWRRHIARLNREGRVMQVCDSSGDKARSIKPNPSGIEYKARCSGGRNSRFVCAEKGGFAARIAEVIHSKVSIRYKRRRDAYSTTKIESHSTISPQELYPMYKRLNSGKSRALLTQVLLITSASMILGCASTEKRMDASVEEAPVEAASDVASDKVSQIDPYEGFNRSMYNFNMRLDKYFFKPVSDGYKFITPDFVEAGVNNFFTNLKGINVVLNDILQGKFRQGASDTGRFLTNTTIGVAGLIDVASELGLEYNIEDFGQTLAVWGVEESTYLVLPVLGPTTIRDGSALVVDKAANPGTYVPFTGVIEGINDRANADGALNFINEAALDPYVFTRESYLQYRQNLINDGKIESGSYESELDGFIDADDLEADGSGADDPVAGPGSKIDDGIQAANDSAKGSAVNSSAFDSMVQSFEQASIKMDQLGKKSGANLASTSGPRSSIQ
ncbi:MAG: MlaA family lipoprotein [Gammaproteobacteria bacterium]